MTPPHGTEALHDRATQLFGGKQERDSSDAPPAPVERDSEEKVTIMFQQAADLPVGIVPVTPAPERPKSDKRDALALPSREKTAKLSRYKLSTSGVRDRKVRDSLWRSAEPIGRLSIP